MLPKIVYVRALDNYNLYIKFSDNKYFIYDATPILWGELGEPLQKKDVFDMVHVESETGLLEWPNGLTIDTLVLYELMLKEKNQLMKVSA